MECTPKGSINKGAKGNLLRCAPVGYTQDLRSAMVRESSFWFRECTSSQHALASILKTSSSAPATDAGNCFELATIAFTYLYQKGVLPLAYVAFSSKEKAYERWLFHHV